MNTIKTEILKPDYNFNCVDQIGNCRFCYKISGQDPLHIIKYPFAGRSKIANIVSTHKWSNIILGIPTAGAYLSLFALSSATLTVFPALLFFGSPTVPIAFLVLGVAGAITYIAFKILFRNIEADRSIPLDAQLRIKQLIKNDVLIAKAIILEGGRALADTNQPIDLIEEPVWINALCSLVADRALGRLAPGQNIFIPTRFENNPTIMSKLNAAEDCARRRLRRYTDDSRPVGTQPGSRRPHWGDPSIYHIDDSPPPAPAEHHEDRSYPSIYAIYDNHPVGTQPGSCRPHWGDPSIYHIDDSPPPAPAEYREDRSYPSIYAI